MGFTSEPKWLTWSYGLKRTLAPVGVLAICTNISPLPLRIERLTLYLILFSGLQP